MEILRIYIIFFTGFFLFSKSLAQEYQIKVQVEGYADSTLLLAHYFARESFIVKDTVVLDNKGQGVFEGNQELPGGLYALIVSPNRLLDLLIDQDQHFSVSATAPDFVETKKVKGNHEDKLLTGYQKYIQEQTAAARRINDMIILAKEEKEKEKFRESLKRLDKKVKKRQDKYIEKNKGTLFSKFLLANVPVKVPDPPRDEQGNVIDSSFQYRYYRAHYFDHFDLFDPRLLRTPFYEKKYTEYIEKVLPQHADTVIPVFDTIMKKAMGNEELFRYLLITSFNHCLKSKIISMEKAWVFLAEIYYIPHAGWSNINYVEELEERVKEVKHTLPGERGRNSRFVVVPSEHFVEAGKDTSVKKNPHVGAYLDVHDIKASYTILHFWSPDCGHCKKSVPKLYKLYQDTLKELGVAVVAVQIVSSIEGKENWIDFVNKHQLYGWINAWNPYSYQYKEDYDIQTSNILYLLDKDKNIIAKRISPGQAKDIILHEMAIQEN